MGNTEITLNGKDWSNLYHLDYHGGCGGELLMGIANIQSPYIEIENDNKGNDSAFGLVAAGSIPDNILIAHIPEKDIENLSEDEYKYVVKALLHLRTTNNNTVFSSNALHRHKVDPINKNWKSDKNFLLRTHDESKNYSSLFPNCKSLRLYSPLDTWHLIQYMMFKKKLMTIHDGDPIQWFRRGVARTVADRYMVRRKFIYMWEWECIVRFKKYIKFEDYLTRKFTPKKAVYEQFEGAIDAAGWVFGYNTNHTIEQIQDTYETIVTEESKKVISKWQQENISMLTDNGLSLSSTPNDIQTKLIEECTRLK